MTLRLNNDNGNSASIDYVDGVSTDSTITIPEGDGTLVTNDFTGDVAIDGNVSIGGGDIVLNTNGTIFSDRLISQTQTNNSFLELGARNAVGTQVVSITCNVDRTVDFGNAIGVGSQEAENNVGLVSRIMANNGTAIQAVNPLGHGGVMYRAADSSNNTRFAVTTVGDINTGANLGNAGNSSPNIRINSSGNINITGTLTENSSDIRFKTQTKSVPNSQLDDIKSLQFKEWTWTEDAPGNDDVNGRRNRGLIAQEAELVDPKLVYEVEQSDGDSYKVIDHQVLLMKLLGAIQELEAEVQALKGGAS